MGIKSNKKHSIDDCKKIAIKHGGFMLSDYYFNNKIKLRWQCAKEHIFESRYNDVQQGHWCPQCAVFSTMKKIKKICLEKYGVEFPIQNKKIKDKMKKTLIQRYGVDNPAKNKDISDKIALSQNNVFVLNHWRTKERIICVGGWEKKVVEYFNKNKIDFRWQPQIFVMPSGKTYRPDLYLINENKWVEIKGYFRDDAKEKWDWFCVKYSNSELWDGKKLKEMNII